MRPNPRRLSRILVVKSPARPTFPGSLVDEHLHVPAVGARISSQIRAKDPLGHRIEIGPDALEPVCDPVDDRLQHSDKRSRAARVHGARLAQLSAKRRIP